MRKERIEIYGRGFPKGFTTLSVARRCTHSRLSGLPKKFFPREPREGEELVELKVDPNGTPYDRGDIILGLRIKSKAKPELAEPHDYVIVQIRPRFTRGSDGFTSWHRYAILAAAKPAEAAKCRAAKDTAGERAMNAMMSS